MDLAPRVVDEAGSNVALKGVGTASFRVATFPCVCVWRGVADLAPRVVDEARPHVAAGRRVSRAADGALARRQCAATRAPPARGASTASRQCAAPPVCGDLRATSTRRRPNPPTARWRRCGRMLLRPLARSRNCILGRRPTALPHPARPPTHPSGHPSPPVSLRTASATASAATQACSLAPPAQQEDERPGPSDGLGAE